ncbi:MAG: MBL fold metallo-hydrolase [Candidatus Tectomicrobia bacterium]|uniref:MBL fold metallo-hydrolase n=1 Tax=Tectimicrobiota bacterium TaxID=2528274 RepID=A0A933GL35_UNCTE|nr:MBL fold metallo-hydrolase [Candidatus Tectomicrobia bacterium]
MFQRQLGQIVINRIIESECADAFYDPIGFFPETTPKDWERHKAWMQPHDMDPATGKLRFAVQSYLLRNRHHTILIDTCNGDYKKRRVPLWNMTTGGAFLVNLANAGVQPDAVDYVICTHIHQDHFGGNTRLRDGRWVPTFPNATYIFTKKEYEHWEAIYKQKPYEAFTDSIIPVVAGGLVAFVTNDYALDDEIWLESTPGHSPDHVCIHLKSDGAEAVIIGDLLHSPVQCQEPTWANFAEFDRELACNTRKAFLERYCDTDVLIGGMHLPSPSMGHIVSRDGAVWFQYERSAEGLL